MVFHAGTALNEEGLTVVSGGRVLCVVGLGESIAAAQKSAYAAARQVKFDGMQMRSDIGYRALNRCSPDPNGPTGRLPLRRVAAFFSPRHALS